MNDREKARDLGNQSAALARSISDVLNDTLDALERSEASVAALADALRECGWHHSTCNALEGNGRPEDAVCDCGYGEALRRCGLPYDEDTAGGTA